MASAAAASNPASSRAGSPYPRRGAPPPASSLTNARDIGGSALELAPLYFLQEIRRVGVGRLGRLVSWRTSRIERRVIRAVLLRLLRGGGRLCLPEQCLELSLVHRRTPESGIDRAVDILKLAACVGAVR